MYIHAPFRVDDAAALHGLMRRYSFATLITAGAEPSITHLPLLLEVDDGGRGTLVGHFARPNPHGQLRRTARPSRRSAR